MKNIKVALLSFLMMLPLMPAVLRAELTGMSDSDLASQTGQALFLMDKVLGDGSSGSTGLGESGITFYKMGLDGVMDINANIKKMQLGCGGVNGVGCDIDIDNLSLSGSASCTGGRPNCDAQLTRPFVQFAIKNDNNPATRQVVGWRFSAEKALGLLTAGYQDAAMSEPNSKNGINTLSGYMNISSATGTGSTAARYMAYSDIGLPLTGRVTINYYGLGQETDYFASTSYNVYMPSCTNCASFTTAATAISGNRMTAARLAAVATLANIPFQCDSSSTNACVTANASTTWGTLSLAEGVTGQIKGLKANVDFTESLGFIHSIPINNPFSLSMQAQNLLWPGAAVQAKTGWWMAIEDPISIGNVSPSNQIAITNAVLQQLAGSTGCNSTGSSCTSRMPLDTYLVAHPPTCLALSCLTGTTLNAGTVDLTTYFSNTANYLYMPLADLKVAAQSITPNCWGNSLFC